MRDEQVTIAIQVNGKLRGTLEIPRGMDKAAVENAALELPQVTRWLEGRPPRERPGAFTEVVSDFLDRHDAFVVSRMPTVIHP
jgi:leucyl-tRNA synthetase